MNIVISGGTKGIGLAIIKKFARRWANIVFCARSIEDVKKLEFSLQKRYPQQRFAGYSLDISKTDQVKEFGEKVLSFFDIIDILIHNAGMFIPSHIIEEEDGIIEQLIETNVYSAYHLTRTLLPQFLKQQDGHIFTLCSIASIWVHPHSSSYSISKFALLWFSKALREELKPHNIRVTAVLPGATLTSARWNTEYTADRFMPTSDIAKMIYSVRKLSKRSVVEEIIIRPQFGDL